MGREVPHFADEGVFGKNIGGLKMGVFFVNVRELKIRLAEKYYHYLRSP